MLLGELWSARELCVTLARKNFFVLYRRTAFGVVWAVLIPVLQALVLALVIGRVAPQGIRHYPVYLLSGILAWAFFSVSLASASTAIVDNSALSSRIYFPRAVLPAAACLANAFALVVSLAIAVVLSLATGAWPGWRFLLTVPAVLLLVVMTTALTELLAAAHVYFRDVRFLVQAALLVWFYITPVFYALSRVRGHLEAFVSVNPLTGPVELLHAGLLSQQPLTWPTVAGSIGWSVGLLAAALAVHARRDRLFADLL